jgi:hypothetical protein
MVEVIVTVVDVGLDLLVDEQPASKTMPRRILEKCCLPVRIGGHRFRKQRSPR